MATGNMGTVDGIFVLNHTVDALTEKQYTLKTQNKFVDQDIVLKISPRAVGTLTFEATDNTATDVTVNTTAVSGRYELTAAISGTVTPSQAGWMSGATAVSDNGVMVGRIPQSNFTGATITPNVSSTTAVTIPAGYYHTSRTVTVNAMSSGQKAGVTSGTANITSLTPAYNSTNDNFTITGSADVSAPTVSTAGYISSSAGTKSANTNGAAVNATMAKIKGTTSFSGSGAFKPAISKNAVPTGVVNAATSDNATTTAPSNGVYVAVKTTANTTTLTATPTVTTAGYGTAANHGIAGNSLTVGASASDVTYVKVKTGSLSFPSGTATISGPTYNSTNGNFDISSSGSVGAVSIASAGYIGDGIGSATAGNVTGSTVLNKIGLGVTVSGGAAVKPTISKQAISISGVTDAAAGTATTVAPTSGVYVKVKTGATTSTVSSQAKVTSNGYGTTTSGQASIASATVTSVNVNASEDTYVSITTTAVTPTTNSVAANNKVTWGSGWVTSGTVSAGAVALSGSKTATKPTIAKTTTAGTNGATNVSASATITTVKPSTAGYFLSVKATAPATSITPTPTVTTGYLGHTSQVSGSVTVNSVAGNEYYLELPTAGFSVSGNKVTVSTAGYIATGTTVGTITTGALSAVASDPGTSFTNNTALVLAENGWLKMTAGYYNATKISLATLVPNGSDVKGHAEYILEGHSAYDNDGVLVSGNITTYTGYYEVT